MSESSSSFAEQKAAERAADDVAKASTYGFLTLSGELRNQIYTYVFKHDSPLLVGELAGGNGAIGL
jgi:hypothetical protein